MNRRSLFSRLAAVFVAGKVAPAPTPAPKYIPTPWGPVFWYVEPANLDPNLPTYTNDPNIGFFRETDDKIELTTGGVWK
jgi:hypothetical protein